MPNKSEINIENKIIEQGPGTGRINMMLESFPLWVPLLAVAFVILGILVLKRYDFSYKKNFPLVAGTLVAAIILSALIINLSGLNDIWSKRGPMRRLYNVNQKDGARIQHIPRYS